MPAAQAANSMMPWEDQEDGHNTYVIQRLKMDTISCEYTMGMLVL